MQTLPQFYSPKNSTFINSSRKNMSVKEISSLNRIPESLIESQKKIKVSDSLIETQKNRKIQRILRYHLGLTKSLYTGNIEIPKQNINKNISTLRGSMNLAQETSYNSLMEKKLQIFKSFQTENKSQSALIKQRDSLTQKLLANLNRNYTKNKKTTNLLEFYETRKKILTMYERTENYPISVFHLKDFSNLRINQDYKINTPKLCLHPVGYACKTALKNMSFPQILTHLTDNHLLNGITAENFASIYNCSENILEQLMVYVFDEKTAIPYLILRSIWKETRRSKQVLIVLHDFFENFMNHINYYKSIMNESVNCSVVLLNYPGQTFTIYDQNDTFNNEDIAKIIDGFIFSLAKQKLIDLHNDTIKLMGFGYGGNILSYFAGSCEGAFSSLHSIILINTFVYIDEMLSEKIKKFCSVLDSNVGEELALHNYLQMTQTSQITKEHIKRKLETNPLDNQHKKKILKGCLQSVNCQLKIQRCETSLYILHSLQNSFVSVIHADILAKANNDYKNYLIQLPYNEMRKYYAENQKRIVAYLDGGHDVLEVIFSRNILVLIHFSERKTLNISEN